MSVMMKKRAEGRGNMAVRKRRGGQGAIESDDKARIKRRAIIQHLQKRKMHHFIRPTAPPVHLKKATHTTLHKRHFLPLEPQILNRFGYRHPTQPSPMHPKSIQTSKLFPPPIIQNPQCHNPEIHLLFLDLLQHRERLDMFS